MNLQTLLENGIKMLKQAQVEESQLKAKLLLCYLRGFSASEELFFHDQDEVDDKFQQEFEKGIQQLVEGMPIQYITNKQEFRKLSFYVDENVLIPQPDTEILVEEAERYMEKMKGSSLEILDLCTGSGCVGISLAKEWESAQVTLLDCSKQAIEVAQKNAKELGVWNQVDLVLSNLFENIKGRKFDGIVSNPPYIKKEEIKQLSKEVQKEPHLALDGGEDGLDFYRGILQNAEDYLKEGGFLCLEMGYNQKDEIEAIYHKLQQEGKTKLKQDQVTKDLAGIERVISFRK